MSEITQYDWLEKLSRDCVYYENKCKELGFWGLAGAFNDIYCRVMDMARFTWQAKEEMNE